MFPTNAGRGLRVRRARRPNATRQATSAARTTACSPRRPTAPAGSGAGPPPGRLRTWIGRPGYVRHAYGAGWALVGDAGSFLDPLSTHGITDALRDAEILARCLKRTGTFDDLNEFVSTRARVISATFDVVDRVAGYGWDLAQLQSYLQELSSAMSSELELVATPMPNVGPW